MSVSRLLEVRAQVRANRVVGPQVSMAADKPLLDGGPCLLPDEIYLLNDALIRYYLPRYRIATGENGRALVKSCRSSCGRLAILPRAPPTWRDQ